MAVKIRLARHGAKKRPYYRIVVADSRMRRDGRFIEQVGRYDPLPDPHVIELDLDRVDSWVSQGAQPTNAVEHLIAIARESAGVSVSEPLSVPAAYQASTAEATSESGDAA